MYLIKHGRFWLLSNYQHNVVASATWLKMISVLYLIDIWWTSTVRLRLVRIGSLQLGGRGRCTSQQPRMASWEPNSSYSRSEECYLKSTQFNLFYQVILLWRPKLHSLSSVSVTDSKSVLQYIEEKIYTLYIYESHLRVCCGDI